MQLNTRAQSLRALVLPDHQAAVLLVYHMSCPASTVSEDVVEEINEVKGYYNIERQEREKAEGEIKEVSRAGNGDLSKYLITFHLLALVQAVSSDSPELGAAGEGIRGHSTSRHSH